MSDSAVDSTPSAEPLPGARTPLKLDVAVDKVSTCERKVRVSIPREDIERYRAESLAEMMPSAQLPGFRPGRAPRTLVGSRFKSEIKDQIRSKLLADAMTQVSETEKLSPISEPDLDVAVITLPEDGPMTFEFSIEVRPEFEMPVWKGLAIKRPNRQISEADVDEALANVLRDRSRLVPHDGTPGPGDLIVANLRFLEGDRELSHVDEVEIVVREKLSLADAEVPGFAELVAKAKPGKPLTTTITLSPEAADEALRGKPVTMEMTLVETKKLELPELTTELLAELGPFTDVAALREAIRKQLEGQLAWHQRREVRKQVSSALTASADWDLPPDLLRRQSQRELERAILELRRSGFDDDSIRRHVNELRQSVMASTAKALKEHFILERIAEDESIADEQGDYDAEIRAIAAQSGESPRRVRASLEKRGLMDVLRNQIIEGKTLDLITKSASFTDVPFAFPRPDTDAVDHAVCGVVVGEPEIPTATQAEAAPARGARR